MQESLDGVELIKDTSPARWIEQRLWGWGPQGVRVGALIPEGFAAYARLIHAGSPPIEGWLPRDESTRLAGMLHEFTQTPQRCWFCIWEGYGFLNQQLYSGVPRVKTHERAYLLFRGPIDAITSFSWGPSWQSPNLWWPDDQRWCVATEIDQPATFVGGSTACIAHLVADAELQAQPIEIEARVNSHGRAAGR